MDIGRLTVIALILGSVTPKKAGAALVNRQCWLARHDLDPFEIITHLHGNGSAFETVYGREVLKGIHSSVQSQISREREIGSN
jgi:hypothetical protein